jgi:hypothetical protein
VSAIAIANNYHYHYLSTVIPNSTNLTEPTKPPTTQPPNHHNHADPTHCPLRVQTGYNPCSSGRFTCTPSSSTSTSTNILSQVCKRMISLADKCMHPTRNEPYVKSHGGGRDNSPEGQQVARILSFPCWFTQEEELTNLYLSHSPGSFHSRIHLRV